MATRGVYLPEAAEYPSVNFPQLTVVNTTERRPVLAFDAATKESAYWTDVAPQGLTGAITVVLTFLLASATTGSVVWLAALEAISDGDAAPNLASAASFDADNSATVAVPGTAGLLKQVTIAVANADALAAGDYLRLRIARDAANAADTAAGDAQLLAVELRDAA